MSDLEQTLQAAVAALGLDTAARVMPAPQVREWLSATSSVTIPPDAQSGMPLTDDSPLVPFHRAHYLAVLAAATQHFCPSTVTIDSPTSPSSETALLRFLGQVLLGGSAQQQEELRVVTATSGAEMHYLAAMPTMFDIFAHLSANEMFFIDGDSLLMYALCNYNVDWDLVQPLHVLSLAQRLLAGLHQRQARFHVVFFDDHEWIWTKAPVKRLLRAILHQGLTNAQKSNPELTVATFGSSNGAKFAAYMIKFEPEFILMTDGECVVQTPASLQRYTPAGERAKPHYQTALLEDVAIGRAAATFYRCFATRVIGLCAQVVFISRIIFKDNAVIAFAAQPSSERVTLASQLSTQLDNRITAFLAAPFKAQQKASDVVVSEADDAAIDAALNDPAKLLATQRHCVVVSALRTFLLRNNTPANHALCQAMLLSVVAMDFMTAADRAQPAADSPALAAFLRALAPDMLAWLKYFGVEDGKNKEWDLFDGHLLFAVTRVLASDAPVSLLDANDLAYANALWGIVTDGAGGSPFAAAKLANLPTVSQPVVRPIPAAAGTGDVKHPMLLALSKATQSPTFAATEDPVDKTRDHRAMQGWMVRESFDDFNDIHCKRVIDAKARDEKEQKKEEKMKKRKALQVKETAESLDELSFMFGNEKAFVVSEDQPAAATKQHHHHQQQAKAAAVSKKSTAEIIQEKNMLSKADRTLKTVHEIVNHLVAKKNALVSSAHIKKEDLASHVTTIEKQNLEVPLTDSSEDVDPALLQEAWERFCSSGQDGTERAKVFAPEKSFPRIATYAKEQITAPASPAFYRAPGITEDVAVRALQKKFCSAFKAHCEFCLKTAVAEIHLTVWKAEKQGAVNSGKRQPNIEAATTLFVSTQSALSFFERNRIQPPRTEIDILRSAIANLDFPDSYVKSVDALIMQWIGTSSPLGELSVSQKNQHKGLLDMTATRFQMQLMGHLLERPVNKRDVKDRVPFKPDHWQCDLLDIIDERGSAVVCAPTSAGKTFISYYCMRNVLKTSNSDMVVYVAPTRALVTQAHADATGRYGKKTYLSASYANYQVVGVAERPDFVLLHRTCQVLVTVPEVLETLLTSHKYLEWTKRLKYVIFDEIHTMESSGNGAVWERLLSLVQCPFVALSATLDKTEELVGWLQRIQDRIKTQHTRDKTVDPGPRAYTVSLIPKPPTAPNQPVVKIQRWNDIMKWIYSPPVGAYTALRSGSVGAEFPFQHIQPLMPLSCVTIEAMHEKFPPDLTLVPKECVELFAAMKQTFDEVLWKNYGDVAGVQTLKDGLRTLEPEKYFADLRYISQSKAREYERDIKQALQVWAAMSNAATIPATYDFSALAPTEVPGFCLDMADTVKKVLGGSRDALKEAEAALNVASPPYTSFDFIQKHMLNVLHELKSRKLGPTIIFSFDNEMCTKLAESICNALEEAEAEYRASDEFKRWAASRKILKEQQEKQLASNSKAVLNKRETDENGNVTVVTQQATEVKMDDYSIPDVLPQFTFITPGQMENHKLNGILDDVKLGATLLYRLFQRGIALHHSGISGKIRTFSETLFRSKHAGIIFASETLALGIHSPCRSVVLAGDHVLLNTTQFRQMMGRAGRRNLDFLGHLVFLGISSKKIDRLMTSDLTVIRGHQYVDPITQLRLLQLHDFDDRNPDKVKLPSAAYAVDAADRMLVNPLFELARKTFKGPSLSSFQLDVFQQVTHWFMQQGLYALCLNRTKESPSNETMLGHLATVLLHTYASPCSGTAGLYFAHLLASGAFHTIPTKAVELMAYCFTKHRYFEIPLEVHRSLLRNPDILYVKATTRADSHNIALPPIAEFQPAVVAAIVKLHVELFTQLSAFVVRAQQHVPQAPVRMPYSARNKKGNAFSVFADDTVDDIPLVTKLRQQARPAAARDPFLAINGDGDFFDSSDDLCQSLRPGLFVDRAMLPILDFKDLHSHDRSQIIVSAAIPDFITCGAQLVTEGVYSHDYNRDWLQRFNGLTPSDSYAALHHFRLLCMNLNFSFVGTAAVGSVTVEALRMVRPKDDDGNVVADAAAAAILDVCEAMHKRENEVNNRAWLDLKEQQWAKEKEEKEKAHAAAKRGM